jgi:hypothetical protein
MAGMTRREAFGRILAASVSLSALTGGFLLAGGCAGSKRTSNISDSGGDEEPLTESDLPDLPEDSEVSRAWKRRKPNGRRGVQAVLLSEWKRKSCDNLIEVCSNSEAPAEIEIGFVPYIVDRNIRATGHPKYALSGVAGSTGAYAQYETIRYVADSLLAIGKSLVVTVHFGFHAGKDGKGHLNPNAEDLRAYISDFYSKFFRDYQSRVRIVLCPSLEDEYRSDTKFKDKVKVIVEQMAALGALTLDGGNVVTNTWVRRSENKASIKAPFTYILKSRFTKPDGTTVKSWKVRVRETEVHGTLKYEENGRAKNLLSRSNVKAYSNDGNFVWFDNPRGLDGLRTEGYATARNANEDDSCKEKANRDDETNADCYKYSLSSFINSTYRSGKVVLLWRPAYNLFEWNAERQTYDKPELSDRVDSDSKPKFDDVEKEALRLFLGVR